MLTLELRGIKTIGLLNYCAAATWVADTPRERAAPMLICRRAPPERFNKFVIKRAIGLDIINDWIK
jgi:hypothetical protein